MRGCPTARARDQEQAQRLLPALQDADVAAVCRGFATVFGGLGGVYHEAWLEVTKPVLPFIFLRLQLVKRGTDGRIARLACARIATVRGERVAEVFTSSAAASPTSTQLAVSVQRDTRRRQPRVEAAPPAD